MGVGTDTDLGAFATDSSGQLDVFRHDGHSLGVDSAQVSVLEKPDQVSLGGFLQGKKSRSLEPDLALVVLSNISHNSLER